MTSQVFSNSQIASIALPRTPVRLPQIDFGPDSYRITDPLPASWFQASPDDAPECQVCGDVLSFVFSPRIDEGSSAGTASSYQMPVAIRCNCFVAKGDSPLALSYHLQLERQPIPLVAG